MNTTIISRRKALTPAQVEEARAICKHHCNKPCNGWVLTPILTIGEFERKIQTILQFRPQGFIQTDIETIPDGW